MASAVEITVLHTVGCANTPPTVALIEKVAADTGIASEVTMLLVESQQQAQEKRFLGSPTVQIAGVDVDPAARDVPHFGLG